MGDYPTLEAIARSSAPAHCSLLELYRWKRARDDARALLAHVGIRTPRWFAVTTRKQHR